MISFLEQIAASVSKEDLPYLYKRCYIFPTKRAAIHFSDFLKKRHPEADFILPETITIQEFITSYSSFIIKDDWYLLLELYQIQHALTQTHQALEKFLPWGKLILKDFDECDKYLVDAVQLFSVLKAHKEIDETFAISEETRRYIEQFILTSSSQKENTYKAEFIKTWSQLGEMYALLQERLRQQHFAYEGMAYREVLENLKDGSLQLPFESISFCGFNALSVCEEEIFKAVAHRYHTEFWWDADEHFMQNRLHEAGNFLREYQQKFGGKNSHWISSHELEQHKNIQIIGVSSDIGQAQLTAQLLSQEVAERTAIVLCNEHLLTPLLYSIDNNKVNITMGYSVTQSELYLFLLALLNLKCNARMTESNVDFYHKDIQVLSEHAYLRGQINNKTDLDKILPLFVPYMPEQVLREFFPETILQTPEQPVSILKNILLTISALPARDAYFMPVKEALTQRLKELISLLEPLSSVIINRSALPFLVKQFIGSAKIPFETNTENQIQVMGFLETRILDFDHLYILSLNDDKLPGTNKINSFIPYNLRKGFGLPTFEQFDGINAYHFYRLLKRATNVHLLYNNQASDNAGEKSRFIRQIQHDLCTASNRIAEYIATYDLSTSGFVISEAAEVSLLKIEKTPETTALLRERKFSPSALKVYIKCPVQFYLKYVAGIDEPEELEEEIDASIFGQILHKVLELIYQPFLNKSLSAEVITSFADIHLLRNQIKAACEELKLPKEVTQGSNRLHLKIIERIVQKILGNDATDKHLQVIHTEEKFIWNGLRLEDGTYATIQGTFDRIDRIDAQRVRIVDYKTGHIELPAFPDMEDEGGVQAFLDVLFTFQKKDYSAAFQGILYALMYYKLFNCTQIYVAYHHAKKMKDGMSYLNDRQPIPLTLLLQFEQRLSSLVSNIIYKEPFFVQSEQEDAYQYSVYSNLLGID